MKQSADNRDTATELMRSIAATFPAELGVTEARMFNGRGLKTGDRFFAFVSSTGRLVVKLPPEQVRNLLEDGSGAPVTMDTRTMREWISVARPEHDDESGWRRLLEAARNFVHSTPS